MARTASVERKTNETEISVSLTIDGTGKRDISVVVGTSLFQIIFVTANVTILQSVQTQTVDFMLAGLLLLGAVIGAQFGSRFGALLKGEQLRGLLALMVLAVSLKLAFDLIITPTDLFSVEILK